MESTMKDKDGSKQRMIKCGDEVGGGTATLYEFVVFRNNKLQEECLRLDILIVHSSSSGRYSLMTGGNV